MTFLRKTKLILAALLVAASFSFGYTALASADARADVCAGVSETGGTCQGDASGTISNIVKLVINILSFIAGIAAVIMIIVAGMRYITSGGDASSISGAKNALIYALVGLVVVALSQIIVHFVLGKV